MAGETPNRGGSAGGPMPQGHAGTNEASELRKRVSDLAGVQPMLAPWHYYWTPLSIPTAHWHPIADRICLTSAQQAAPICMTTLHTSMQPEAAVLKPYPALRRSAVAASVHQAIAAVAVHQTVAAVAVCSCDNCASNKSVSTQTAELRLVVSTGKKGNAFLLMSWHGINNASLNSAEWVCLTAAYVYADQLASLKREQAVGSSPGSRRTERQGPTHSALAMGRSMRAGGHQMEQDANSPRGSLQTGTPTWSSHWHRYQPRQAHPSGRHTHYDSENVR